MRTLKEANLGTRKARLDLDAKKRHWRQIDPELHLFYRRGARGGKWGMRAYMGQGRYALETLGIADDFNDADGEIILSFADAQRRARKRFVILRRRAKHLDPESRRGKYTVNECLDDYLAAKDGLTKRNLKYIFDYHVRPVLGHMAVQDLTRGILQRWLRDDAEKLPPWFKDDPEKLSLNCDKSYDPDDPENIRKRQASANTRWVFFCAALNYQDKGIPSEAWDAVEKFGKVAAWNHTFFTMEECSRLVAVAAVDFSELLRGAFVTGARQAELTALLVGDLNEQNRTLHVLGKGGKHRHVILNDEGVAFFRSMSEGRLKTERMFLTSEGKRWNASSVNKAMHKTLDAAGICVPRGIGMHACRHTYCSWGLMSGMNMMALAQNLGHADTRQIERVYGHLTRNFVRDTILQHAPTYGFENSAGAA